jgi:hypothetical protein
MEISEKGGDALRIGKIMVPSVFRLKKNYPEGRKKKRKNEEV